MTPNPSDLAALLKRSADVNLAAATPSRMIVDSVDADGLVLVKSVRAGAVAEGPYERLARAGTLQPGDAVLVQPVVGTNGRGTMVVVDKLGPPSAGPSTVVATGSQSVADTTSTTDTVAYQTAITVNIALGEGTWSIGAVGGLLIRHSVGSANWLVEIDGNAGTARSLFITTEMQMVDDHNRSGVAGDRTVAVKVRYRGSDPGTTSARNPWAMVVATRE